MEPPMCYRAVPPSRWMHSKHPPGRQPQPFRHPICAGDVLIRLSTATTRAMSSTIPQIVIAKPAKSAPPNGVLPVPASTTQAGAHQGATLKPSSQKLPSPRLKVVIRRLPPALTEQELREALGSEWALGGGRMDWMSYKSGKSSPECATTINIST